MTIAAIGSPILLPRGYATTLASRGTPPGVSPRLQGRWKCDDGSGFGPKDSSGFGRDLAPNFAPFWEANKTHFTGWTCSATSRRDVYFEETGGGNKVTGATEPAWNFTPGATTADGTGTWTCRAAPDYWTTRPGWITLPNAFRGQMHMRQRNPCPEIFGPPQIGPAYTAATISTNAAAFTITDTANGLLALQLAVGDWLQITGGSATNNVFCLVAAVAAGTITCANGLGPVVTEGPLSFTLYKCAPPSSIVLACWMKSQQTNALPFFDYEERWGTAEKGIFIGPNAGSPPLMIMQYIDETGTGSAVSCNSIGTNDIHVCIAVNRETSQMCQFNNGVRTPNLPFLTSRMRLRCSPAAGTSPTMMFFYQGTTPSGVVQFRDVQLYVGPGLPGDLCQQSSGGISTLALKMMGGAVLSASDWP